MAKKKTNEEMETLYIPPQPTHAPCTVTIEFDCENCKKHNVFETPTFETGTFTCACGYNHTVQREIKKWV